MSNSFLALYYIMPRLTNHLVYVPKLGHSTRSHLIRGKGAGKLLLDRQSGALRVFVALGRIILDL